MKRFPLKFFSYWWGQHSKVSQKTCGNLEDRSTIAQLLVENLNSEGIDLEDYTSTYKAFDRAYFDAREHYISNYVRGIISTAATAVDRMFRHYNPHLIEEASRLTEGLGRGNNVSKLYQPSQGRLGRRYESE